MLSALFWGEITLRDGRVEQSNFDDQRLLRLAEMPAIEVVVAPSGGFWGGVGETGVAVVAPALANALFAATGERVRTLPQNNAGFELAPRVRQMWTMRSAPPRFSSSASCRASTNLRKRTRQRSTVP